MSPTIWQRSPDVQADQCRGVHKMNQPFIQYVSVMGDRWDTIAWKNYGAQFMAGIGALIEANPSVPISAVLPQGTAIGVPILAQAASTSTEDVPPWGNIL
jgi:phage tail protein X